jgi:anaerobic selenocysteine-containing dehydrogenase
VEYPRSGWPVITGVPKDNLEAARALRLLPRPSSLLYAMGITQHTTGVDNVKSCCNLAMLCGNVGVPSGGVNPCAARTMSRAPATWADCPMY